MPELLEEQCYELALNNPERVYKDPRTGEKKEFGFAEIETKVHDAENGIIDITISTIKRDRDGDILVPEGGVFDNFGNNPCGLWSHRAGELPIFKVLSWKVTKTRIDGRIQFAIREREFAREVFTLYANKYLRAFSIGFIPLEWEVMKEADDNGYERFVGYKYTKWECVEWSAVNIPSNPDALMRHIKSIQDREIRKLLMKNLGVEIASHRVFVDGSVVELTHEGDTVRETKTPLRITLTALKKSIEERISKGLAATTLEVIDQGEPQSGVDVVVLQQKEGIITEAKVLRVFQRVLSGAAPDASSGRTPGNDEPADEPQDLHSVEKSVMDARTRLSQLRARVAKL